MQFLDAPDLPADSAGAYPTQAAAPAVAVQTRCWREQDSNHRFRGGRARRFVCRFSFTPTFRLAGNQPEATLKDWSCHAGPMVRILSQAKSMGERVARRFRPIRCIANRP